MNAPKAVRTGPKLRLASAFMKTRLADEENSDAPLVMASLSTVTDVFEAIVRKGIAKGIFNDADPKLIALNALFSCHMWSLHTRALRAITLDINEFFEMQSNLLLNGLLRQEAPASKKQKPRASARLNAVASSSRGPRFILDLQSRRASFARHAMRAFRDL